MKDLLIFPFGGNARESLLAIEAQNNARPTWNVLGFMDDDKKLWGEKYCGVDVLGGRELLRDFPSARVLAVPGSPENFSNRANIIALLRVPLNRFVTIIDPSVRKAPDTKIGKNTLLMPNVVISSSAEIGNHCIVLPNTVIHHDSCIGDYTVIGSNVSVSGSCNIGHGCYIGSGTRIKDHLNIGSNSLIGIGSCVIHNVSHKTIVAGCPARILRNLDEYKEKTSKA
jgi:sugar O-acyltransferase (sialic acid O-acetyltransferase NeuD family)